MNNKEHKQLIQNFLNMVCFDTQGKGGDSEKLKELLDEYFEEEDLYE
jgi:hemerythrin